MELYCAFLNPAAQRMGSLSLLREERTFGWVAVDEVAIALDQGLGDNRRSSFGPLYRCNVDYEA